MIREPDSKKQNNLPTKFLQSTGQNLSRNALYLATSFGLTIGSTKESIAAVPGVTEIPVNTIWYNGNKPTVVPQGYVLAPGVFYKTVDGLVPNKEHKINVTFTTNVAIEPFKYSDFLIRDSNTKEKYLDSYQYDFKGSFSRTLTFTPKSSKIEIVANCEIGDTVSVSNIYKPSANLIALAPEVQTNGDIKLYYTIENSDFRPVIGSTLRLEAAVHKSLLPSGANIHILYSCDLPRYSASAPKKLIGGFDNFSVGTHGFHIPKNALFSYTGSFDLIKTFINRPNQNYETNRRDNEKSLALADSSIENLKFDGKGGFGFKITFSNGGLETLKEIPIKIIWSKGTDENNWRVGLIGSEILSRTCKNGDVVNVAKKDLVVPLDNDPNLSIKVIIDPDNLVPQKIENKSKGLKVPRLSYELATAPVAETAFERVKLWMAPYEKLIISEAKKHHIDPRAITGPIAWEAMINIDSTGDFHEWIIGPAKLHPVKTYWDGNPLNQFYEVGAEAEDMGLVEPKLSTFIERGMAMSTPEGAIRYIAGIMSGFSIMAEQYVRDGKFLFVRNRPDILASWYQGNRPNKANPKYETGIKGLGDFFTEVPSYTPNIPQVFTEKGATGSTQVPAMGYWIQQNMAEGKGAAKGIDKLLSVTYAPNSRTKAVPKPNKDIALIPKRRSAVIDVLSNDGDSVNKPLGLFSVTQPRNGKAEIVNGKVLYTPAGEFKGKDTFYYLSYDSEGIIAGSGVDVDVVEPTPDAATDLRVTSTTQTSAILKWTDRSSNEEKFVVEIKSQGGAWTFKENVPPNSTTATINSLLPGRPYEARIIAVNIDGGTSTSGIVAFNTKIQTVVPAQFTLNARTQTSISLSWGFNDPNADRFQVMYRIPNRTDWSYLPDPRIDTRSLEITGLTANTQHEIRMRAVYKKPDGTEDPSGWSNVIAVSTLPFSAVQSASATVLSASSIQVQWQIDTTGHTRFQLMRRETPGGSWQYRSDLGPTIRSFQDTGLPSDKEMQYQIRAIYFNEQISDWKATAVVRTQKLIVVPERVKANILSNSTIVVSWAFNDPTADRLQLMYRIPGKSDWQYLPDPRNGTGEIEVQGLKASTTYELRMRSVYKKADGTETPSSWSETITATTSALLSVQSATASALSSNSVQVQWQINGTGHIRFQAIRHEVGVGWQYVSDPAAGDRSFQDTGLKSNKEYWYEIRAIYPNEEISNWQATSIVRTQQVPVILAITPTNLRAVGAYAYDVVLGFDHPLTEGQFLLEQNSPGQSWFRAMYVDGRSRSISIANLQPNTYYEFAVRHLTSDNKFSEHSNIIGVQTAPAGQIETPTSLRSNSPGPDSVHLEWSLISTAFRFVIERWSAATGWIRVGAVSGTIKSFDDTGLQPSTEYQYAIRGVSPYGHLSEHSNIIAVTTSAGKPGSPNDLHRGQVGTNWFDVAWNDNANNETHQEVWIKPDGGSFNLSENVAANTRNARIEFEKSGGPRLKPNTLYTVRVYSVNSAGRSQYDEVQIRTQG